LFFCHGRNKAKRGFSRRNHAVLPFQSARFPQGDTFRPLADEQNPVGD
jgi:hypothetical protein